VIPIALVFAFRMLGLFMLIPVFTLFAPNLAYATPTLIGVALGSYGLTQGLLQIPFGWLSDYVGRKKIITLGLLLFMCGSLIGALTQSIYGMIAARILQGAGAIGSVLIALMADLTEPEKRTQAMAVIGVSIGVSFSLAMVISPALTHVYGLSSIFYVSALLALSGIGLVYYVIPTPAGTDIAPSGSRWSLFKPVLSNQHLWRLNLGIFFQHFILTATFFVLPLMLKAYTNQQKITASWHFYLPIMLGAFILMAMIIYIAEKKQWIKPVFIASVLLTMISQLGLAFFSQSWWWFSSFVALYFMVFNVLEANLPALITKLTTPTTKGTAMGVYSSSQFLGIFVGGVSAGFVYQYGGMLGVWLMNAGIAGIWGLMVLPMKTTASSL